jgi:hypothetical protein
MPAHCPADLWPPIAAVAAQPRRSAARNGPIRNAGSRDMTREPAHREREAYAPGDHWDQNPYDVPRGDRPRHRDLRDSRW